MKRTLGQPGEGRAARALAVPLFFAQEEGTAAGNPSRHAWAGGVVDSVILFDNRHRTNKKRPEQVGPRRPHPEEELYARDLISRPCACLSGFVLDPGQAFS